MFTHLPNQTTLARRALGLVIVGLVATGISSGASELPPPVKPKVTFTKVLKGSVPEYTSITVDSSGAALYEGRKLDDAASPRALHLTSSTTQRIFELAAALGYFEANDLESHRKVANLGRKSFTYDDGKRMHRVEFNYTLRREAQDLAEIFERISTVAQHIAALEYAIKYDHLNLPAQLRQIQRDLNRHALTEPELMAPTLEKIARNPRFLHLAQSRAQDLLGRLHSRE